MEEFKPKKTLEAKMKAREKLLESLGEDASISDKELILKHGNPSEKDVDKVIKKLEWGESVDDKEHAKQMEHIDKFLFYNAEKIKDWQDTVEHMVEEDHEIFTKSKVKLYNQLLQAQNKAKTEWSTFANQTTEMQKRIYGDIIRTLGRLIYDLASSLKKNR